MPVIFAEHIGQDSDLARQITVILIHMSELFQLYEIMEQGK